MSEVNNLCNVIRSQLPKFIEIDMYRSEEFDEYELRFYNRDNKGILRVNIGSGAFLNGSYVRVVHKALQAVTNHWNSKLHKAMR